LDANRIDISACAKRSFAACEVSPRAIASTSLKKSSSSAARPALAAAGSP